MAKPQLIISDLGSLNFHKDRKTCGMFDAQYEQKFLSSDPITVQYAAEQGDFDLLLNFTVKNIATDETVYAAKTLVGQSDGYNIYNLTFTGLEWGCYLAYFSINNADVEVAQFGVYESLPDTMLFEYGNTGDSNTTIFAGKFCFRTEAQFYPQNEEYGLEKNDFRDADYYLSQLSANPSVRHGLTIGQTDGVPNWVANKLNQMFSLSDVLIGETEGDRIQYTAADGESIKRGEVIAGYPLYQFSITLEKSDFGAKHVSVMLPLTYSLPGATPATTTLEYGYGEVVQLQTPQQLGMALPEGYQFDGWKDADGNAITEVTINSDTTVTGSMSLIQVSLMYFIAEATPSEVVETYDYGTTVVLKSPSELGMTLPDGSTFLGWIDGGEIITEITLTHDKVMEGEMEVPRANLLRGTRRFLADGDVLNYEGKDVAYPDYTARQNNTNSSLSQLVMRQSDEPAAVGTQYVLSFVLSATGENSLQGREIFFDNRGAFGDETAIIRKIYIDGVEEYSNSGDAPYDILYLPINTNTSTAFIEMVVEKDMDSVIVDAVVGADHVAGQDVQVRYFKLEDVTGLPEDQQRATPWIPHVDDAPDALPDSYYTLNTDTDGRLHPFTLSDTPATNFSSVDPVIAGTTVRGDTIRSITFGASYYIVMGLPNNFLAGSSGVLERLDLSGFVNLFAVRDYCFCFLRKITSLDLSMTQLNSIGSNFCAYSTSVKTFNFGSIDPSLLNGSDAFAGLLNDATITRIHKTQALADAWVVKYPQMSNWTVVIA